MKAKLKGWIVFYLAGDSIGTIHVPPHTKRAAMDNFRCWNADGNTGWEFIAITRASDVEAWLNTQANQ